MNECLVVDVNLCLVSESNACEEAKQLELRLNLKTLW